MSKEKLFQVRKSIAEEETAIEKQKMQKQWLRTQLRDYYQEVQKRLCKGMATHEYSLIKVVEMVARLKLGFDYEYFTMFNSTLKAHLSHYY